jgi:hypothetical protein
MPPRQARGQPLHPIYALSRINDRRISVALVIVRVLSIALLVTLLPYTCLAEDCQPPNPEKLLSKKGETAPPTNELPSPPVENDCAFDNWAWQSFLYVDTSNCSTGGVISSPR